MNQYPAKYFLTLESEGKNRIISINEKEDQFYQLHCQGKTLKQIDEIMIVGKESSRYYGKTLRRKFGVKTNKEMFALFAKAYEHRIFPIQKSSDNTRCKPVSAEAGVLLTRCFPELKGDDELPWLP